MTDTPTISAAGAGAMRRTASIAVVYCAIVLVAMVANAVASRRADPVQAYSLVALQHDLSLSPTDERLKARIRKADVALRRDYFRHRDFAVRGAWLLLAGLVAYLWASEMARRSNAEPPTPRPDAAERARQAAEATRRSVIAVGGLLGGGLLTLTVLARHDTLADYAAAAAKAPPTAAQVAGTQKSGAVAAGLPVSTGLPAPSGIAAGVPQPQGGSLSATGTRLLPMQPVTGAAAAAPPPVVDAGLLKKPPVAIVAVMAPDWEKNWPRFRGPEGTGVASTAQPPLKWDATKGEGLLWKSPVPLPGMNSPIVWGDRVFLSGATADKREVYCYDLNTGALVWRRAVPLPQGVPVPKVQADTGHAPSTMATDGARICAMFVTGDVVCLDMAGNIVWTRQFGPLDNPYGHATSLAIYGSGLIVQLDQGSDGAEGKSALLALDLAKGETVWKITRNVPHSWATPIVIRAGEQEQIITCANPWVIAYDPTTGAEIWRADVLGGEVAVSPVFGEGYVLVANQGANSAAIRPDGKGNVTKAAVAWTAGDGLPDIASPLRYGDLMLLVTTEGFLTCVDVKTGKRVWEHDIEETIRSSPTLAAGRIYMTDVKGVTHVLEPGRTFKKLAASPIGEETNASPAFVGGRVLIRGKQHLFCLGSK